MGSRELQKYKLTNNKNTSPQTTKYTNSRMAKSMSSQMTQKYELYIYIII